MLKKTSDRNKKTLKKLLAALALTVLTAVFGAVGVLAAEAGRMPDLEAGRKGTLQMTMTYREPGASDDTKKVLANVPVKLAQVADMTVTDGIVKYTLRGHYQSSGVVFENMTASGMNQAAATLASMTAGDSVITQNTGADGKVLFTGLVPGMYLVFQDTGANTAYKVDAIAPMLLSVPYAMDHENGGYWIYDVEAEPKTEVTGPKDNGVIRVTKVLINADTGLPVTPPDGETLTFYVGLFEDAECTIRVPGTTDMPLVFQNGSSSTVTFENLTTDKTYYIAETDGKGNVIDTAAFGDITFTVDYPDGQSITITPQHPNGELTFHNNLIDVPDAYYYSGTLTITKRTTKDGEDYKTDKVFYVGVFEDAELTKLSGNVAELRMDGSSSVSIVEEDIYIGKNEDDSVTYYVAETDKDGNPLRNDGSHEFIISIDHTNGKVTLSPKNQEEEVTITNDFTENLTPTPTPTVTPDEPDEPDNPPADRTDNPTKPPKTGDNTPIMHFIVLLAAAVVLVILTGIVYNKKYKR